MLHKNINLVNVMKAHDCRGRVACIIDLDMRMISQLHCPADLIPGKEQAVHFAYEVGWAPKPLLMF